MEVFAERVLKFVDKATGQESPVRVVVGRPVQMAFPKVDGEETGAAVELTPGEPIPESANLCWFTNYEIHGPGPDEVRRYHGAGEDSMQALILTLQILPEWLNLIRRRGQLSWLDGFEADLGFEGLVRLAVDEDFPAGYPSCALGEKAPSREAEPGDEGTR